ncbi:MAG: AsmA family protein [Alphaproteobacteria bacterium]
MKIVYGVAAFIALVLLALFVVPLLIGWDGLKPTIAERAEERFGRRLAIDGPIDVRLLPVPKIVARDVRLANLPGASSADMARAKQVDLELALGPLIGGELEVVRVDLIDPVIELERLVDGTANWHLGPKAAPPQEEAGGEAAPGQQPESAPAPEAQGESGVGMAAIQSVSLSNGAVTYRDARTGEVEHLHGIEATATAREPGGPYQARGSMTLREAPLGFEATLGRGGGGAPTPVSITLRLDDDTARLGFVGQVEPDAGRAAGTLTLEGGNFQAAVQRLGMAVPERAPDLVQPFALEGAVSGEADRFDAKELKLRIGETSATGAASYVSGEPSQLDLVLVLNSLDLDALTAQGEAAPAQPADRAAPGEAGPAAAGDAAPGGFLLPGDLTASVNLTVEAVKYRGRVIRALQSIIALDRGVVAIHQATAELPGGAGASLTGRLSAPRDRPLFEGTAELRADNLRALAGWLGIDLARVPADRLRRLAATADIQADDENVLISRLDAKLDNSTIAGSLSIAAGGSAAAHSQITANLTLDRLALDGYLPQDEAAASGPPPPSGDEAAGAGEAPSSGGANAGAPPDDTLSRYDIAGTLSIQSLSYRDLSLAGIEVNPLWRDGVLTIGELKVADMAGVALAASGEGRGLDGDAPQLKARIDARAASLAPLGRALGLDPSFRLDTLGRSTLGLDMAGTFQTLTLNGGLQSEAGRLSVAGDVQTPRETPRFALDIELADATEDSLRSLVGARPPRRAAAPTPVSLRGRLSGEPDAVDFAAESITYGETELAGTIGVRFGGVRPYVTADLKSPRLAAPAKSASAPSGAAASGASGGGATAATGGPGTAGRDAAALPSGPSRWSREPFNLDLLQQVDGEFKIAADRLALGDWLTENFAVASALKDGVLTIETMSGRLFDGALSGSGRVTGGAQPDYAIRFGLAEADIDAVLRAVGKADAATGRVSLDGAFDADGNSEYAVVSSLDGEITVRGRDGTIEGIDLGAVLEPLAGLRNLSDLGDAGGLVRAGLSKGRTEIRSLDGTIRFTNGVGRTDDMRLVADAGVGEITGEADLPRWQLDMTAMFTVNQPQGTPPFGVRFLGPIDKPSREFRLDPLLASIGERLKQRLLEDENIQLKLRKGAKAEPGTPADAILRGVFGDPDRSQGPSGPELEGAPPPEGPPPAEAAPEPQRQPGLLDLLKRVVPEAPPR